MSNTEYTFVGYDFTFYNFETQEFIKITSASQTFSRRKKFYYISSAASSATYVILLS